MTKSEAMIGQSIFDEVTKRFPGRYVNVSAPDFSSGPDGLWVLRIDNHYVSFEADKLDEAIAKILERESYTNA